VAHPPAKEEGLVELTEAQFENAGIVLGKVEMKNMSNTLAVNGVLDVPPQNMVSVSAIMGGFVTSTQLLQGLRVKKGQVIATIQNLDFIRIQSAYLENKSKLIFMEKEYERQVILAGENVSTSKVLQEVTADYTSLQAKVGALEEELKLLHIDPLTLTKSNIRSTVNIYAPIDGSVTAVNVNIGKYVQPQDVICEIVDTEHLHAELTVFEKDISKIKKGQKIRFVLVNESNVERTASVYLINHQIAPDRTIRVHAHLDKEDPNLIPNMYLKAFIEVGEGNKTTVLPERAIVGAEGKQYIFIKEKAHAHEEKENGGAEGTTAEEHVFKSVEVQKGISENGYTEVILPKGFHTKDEVVIKGAYDVLSKMNNSEEEEGHSH
jgi:cobalt-zinc-cadmium efflux system membrane fusion protein